MYLLIYNSFSLFPQVVDRNLPSILTILSHPSILIVLLFPGPICLNPAKSPNRCRIGCLLWFGLKFEKDGFYSSALHCQTRRNRTVFSHSPKNRRKGFSLQKTNMAMFFWDWKTPENQHDIGKSPFAIGNTSSFMVVFPLSC